METYSYKDLKVWQNAINLATSVYHLTSKFSRQEMYGLSHQIQKAVVSVPSNRAEGAARNSTKEFLYFVSIALGSLAELETQLILASLLTYIENQDLETIVFKTNEVGRMIRGLQKSLRAKLTLTSH